MRTETLVKIKTLRQDAAALDHFHEMFAVKYTADRDCDKKQYGFGVDSRFSSFRTDVSFDSLVGYYGNSGCTTVLRPQDASAVAAYMVKAMNVHQRELFATAARLMREEAASLTVKAAAELAALQALLDEASAFPAPPVEG